MPFFQPATLNYFGFQPAQENPTPSANVYQVSSSEANDISMGDVVCFTTDKNTVRRVVARADVMPLLGIAASRVAAGDGSTAANPRLLTTQTVLIWDNPNTLFVSQDTSSGVIGAGLHVGKSFQVCCSGVVGSTGPNPILGRSVMAISGVTASSGSDASFRFRLVGLHPIENAWSTIAATTASSTGENRKLILKPDFHVYNAGFGAGHVTT